MLIRKVIDCWTSNGHFAEGVDEEDQLMRVVRSSNSLLTARVKGFFIKKISQHDFWYADELGQLAHHANSVDEMTNVIICESFLIGFINISLNPISVMLSVGCRRRIEHQWTGKVMKLCRLAEGQRGQLWMNSLEIESLVYLRGSIRAFESELVIQSWRGRKFLLKLLL